MRQHLIPALLLLALTVAAYGDLLEHDFLTNWDDAQYVTDNEAARGLSLQNLELAFTNYYVGNYAPLQIVSYMVDYEIWGLRAPGYLLTNLLLHAANGLLLYTLLILVGAGRAWSFVASFIFLLHPVQVESVAWISQRKNVLALFFFLIGLLLYMRFSRRGRGAAISYAGSLVGFALALLSKSVAVILPLVLVLYDLCYGDAKQVRRRLVDKLPYVAVALVALIVALRSQSPELGGGRAELHGGSLLATVLTMIPVLVRYLGLLFWPLRLSAIYLPPIRLQVDSVVVLSAGLLALLVLLGAFLYRKRQELFFWYALFFVGLLPVSQLIPLVTLMNDRYLYVPLLGGSAFLAGLFAWGLERLGGQPRRLLQVVACLVLLPLPVLTFQRTQAWANAVVLWRDTVRKVPDSKEAWYGLADALHESGDRGEALSVYSRSLALDPRYPDALIGVAILLGEMGEPTRSRQALLQLVETDPSHAEGWLHLGYNYHRVGDLDPALEAYQRGLDLDPRATRALIGLVNIHRHKRGFGEARELYRRAAALGARDGALEYDMACIEALGGQPTAALAHLERALELGYGNRRSLLEDPDLDPLRHRPEFERLIAPVL